MTQFPRSFLNRLSLTSLVLLLPCSVACTGSQLGGDIGVDGGDGHEANDDGCITKGETPLTPGEVSSLGFSAEEVIGDLNGTHTVELSWASAETEQATVTPAQGLGELTIEISAIADSAVLEDRAKNEDDCSGVCPLIDVAESCGDRMAFEADVHLRSDNGALDEEIRVTFYAGNAQVAHASAELDPRKLGGTAAVEPADPEQKVTRLFLELALVAGAASGHISALLESNDGQVASASLVELGHFPVETCEFGYYVPKDSALVTEAEAALAELDQFTFALPGREATGLSLEHVVGEACFIENDFEPPRLVLFTETKASTEDEGINGKWALEAYFGYDEAGEIHSVELLRQAYLTLAVPGAEFASSSGISAVSVDPMLNATFSFSVSDDLTDGSVASGELTLIEIGAAPECSTEPEQTDEGGSAPGCDGPPSEELATATIMAK